MRTNRLIEIASEGLINKEPQLNECFLALAGDRAAELITLLSRKNGFYAFESALHMFPSDSSSNHIGLDLWNSQELWKSCYGSLTEGCLFFAEDIFGEQFCIKQNEINLFDPETGETELIAKTFSSWEEKLLDDYETLTGYQIAHAWQTIHGALPYGYRLVPQIPFILGGQFSVDNLFALEAEKGMRFRGELATKIKHLPPGAKIEFKIVP